MLWGEKCGLFGFVADDRGFDGFGEKSNIGRFEERELFFLVGDITDDNANSRIATGEQRGLSLDRSDAELFRGHLFVLTWWTHNEASIFERFSETGSPLLGGFGFFVFVGPEDLETGDTVVNLVCLVTLLDGLAGGQKI